MKPKIYFCTFADSRLQLTLKRIENEAKSSGFFDKIFIFNEFNLNKEFKKKFKNVLKYNVRGFGYWIWKVSIIQDVLNKLNEGDILLYADSGCSINKNGLNKFNEYIKLVNETKLGILAVELEEGMIERKYTKGDLFDYFNIRDNDSISNSSQIQAGIILVRKNKKVDMFFKDWQKVFEADFSLINDEPSMTENFPDFITHRHDQSIFSILFKLSGGETIPLSDVWVKEKSDIDLLKNSPIWYLRNKNKKIEGIKWLFYNWIKFILGIGNKL
jgi:hypothetical protein